MRCVLLVLVLLLLQRVELLLELLLLGLEIALILSGRLRHRLRIEELEHLIARHCARRRRRGCRRRRRSGRCAAAHRQR